MHPNITENTLNLDLNLYVSPYVRIFAFACMHIKVIQMKDISFRVYCMSVCI